MNNSSNDISKSELLKLQEDTNQEWQDDHNRQWSENQLALAKQQLNFRENIKKHIIKILYAEIGFLFILIILQGFNLWGFGLNEWVFGLFINGCLLQTIFLVRHIVVHLFPNHNGKKHN